MRWISVSFLARLDALGEGLRGQPELQQDDSMADVQGGRAEGCGRICVPRQLNESQHQQPGSEEWILPISRSAALGLLRPWTTPPSFSGHSFRGGGRSSRTFAPSPRLSRLVPEQVCEPACRHGPQEVGQGVEIPDVELVVEGAAEADADEVGGEEGGHNL